MLRSITTELRVARDVVHGARSLAPHIASLLEPALTGVLEEAGNLPERWLGTFQMGLAALIDKDRRELIEAERSLRKERRKESALQKRREEAKSELYRRLLKARSFLEGTLGSGSSASLVGLDPNLLQQEALVLLRYGAEASEELSRPDLGLTAFVIDRAVISPQEYAARIREATDELQSWEDQLADQERVSERRLKVKTRLLERLHRGLGSCGRILEELYVLAGEDFHAERLRRTSRRRSPSPDDDGVLDEHGEADPLDDPDLGDEPGDPAGDPPDPEPQDGTSPDGEPPAREPQDGDPPVADDPRASSPSR